MTKNTIREGGCGCGAVRYRITCDPMMVHNCHCRLCQRESGSTSVVNAFIETDRIEILQGELIDRLLPGGSGELHTIRQCRACGTALWSHYPRLGTLSAGVRAGSLDDPDSIKPDVVIFTESKMPWVTLPEGIPAFERYYDFREVLPQENRDRLMALVARRKAGEGS
ncbi:GFA family protein [Croceibacterium aestuarii]|uniref:GFA family protein n=1 Tax=Croceibacterium aestuarii TaxID=3064139 RepID=UPI00272ED8F5|nr:GFA family protein [Croceibacterium sp. D39]